MAAHKQISVADTGKVSHVRFLDSRITDTEHIHCLGEELLALFEKDRRNSILLDFENVVFLSSSALGKLIKLNNRMKTGGGKLRLAAIRPEIYEVFRITKLDETFQIFDTVSDAMESF
jgi:anti-sigma B factor antagonist